MTASPARDTAGTDVHAWRSHPRWGTVPRLTFVNGEVPCSRLVVVAAHPGDESLATGGLVATAATAGLAVYVVLLTAGEASHPRSVSLSRHALATQRLAEAERALGILAPDAPLVFLGAPDGGVAGVESAVTDGLVELIGDGRSTLLVAPWRRDGHPDHEAAGRAAAAAAELTGARLAEYPVWTWHHSLPEDAPWPQMRRVDLSAQVTQRKWLAIQAHATQVKPLPSAPGLGALLPPSVLAHFSTPVEHLVTEPVDARSSSHLSEGRWHEQRLRQLVLAMLPRPRFRRALAVWGPQRSPTDDLAAHCDEVVTVGVDHDGTPAAHPTGRFDLVVVYGIDGLLDPVPLGGLVDRIGDYLEPDGTIVLCRARQSGADPELDGAVSDRLSAGRLPPPTAHYADPHLEISVLCPARHWRDDPTA